MSLLSASDKDLGALAVACEPDTSGINASRDRLRSHSKAGKLDPSQFSSTFDLSNTDIPQIIKENLIIGKQENHRIRFELCKLNVFSKH